MALVKQQVICKSMHTLAVPVVIGRTNRNGANEGTGRRRAGTESSPPSVMVGTTPCLPVCFPVGICGGNVFNYLHTYMMIES